MEHQSRPGGQGTGATDITELWHAYRTPVIGVILATYIVVGLYRFTKSRKKQNFATTQKSSTIAEKPRYASPAISVDELGAKVKVERAAREEYKPAKRKPKSTRKVSPKRIVGLKTASKIARGNPTVKKGSRESDDFTHLQTLVLYASQTQSTAAYAEKLSKEIFTGNDSAIPKLSVTTPSNEPRPDSGRKLLPVQAYNIEDIELEDYFLSLPAPPVDLPEGSKVKFIYLVLLPSYDPPESSPAFQLLEHLQETHNDFRVDTAVLQQLGGFSVFGFGDSSEWGDGSTFCRDALQADRWLGKLTGGIRGGRGSRRISPIGIGDVNPDVEKETGLSVDDTLKEWRIHVEEAILDYLAYGVLGDADLTASPDSDDEDSDGEGKIGEEFIDVEDLGAAVNRESNGSENSNSSSLAIDFTKSGKPKGKQEQNEMVPKGGATYTALTKQGYTIVGSHSGVKICRWTKSALRGRGSCYKYSFYGIKSHLCMETTPSLSCSNKCVFCWRHGTNPVGTSWRWKVDPPDEIFKGVVEGHYRKIKMMKGVPGIRADRFAEAFRIRHCALSLVGEPIFYPHINEFLHLLHSSRISSFLVCNAQHPEQLAALDHVTQLYVSIDASNKDSLKRIDRPLHRDFWERFQRCLEILREARNRQRTVFRLTLVKGFNIEEEAEGYADLVEKALPCFIEIKGVTFCGTTTAVGAGLRMDNVPWYEEVKQFVYSLSEALKKRGLDYGLAAEHAHSCCALLADSKFNIDGKWHTHIDYEKFFDLLESGKEFGPLDYIGAETPEWATWGNGGFNPEDTRVYTKGRNKGKIGSTRNEM